MPVNYEKLNEHRKQTKSNIMKILEFHQRVCVVRPCSWGKSHLIADLCNELNGRKLILEPTNILEGYLKRFDGATKESVCIDTYQKLLHKTKTQLKEMYGDIQYIFLDEVHRVGAKKWGKAIRLLCDTFFNAKVIGMSATPIRNDGNDIVETVFNGIQVEPLFLGKAIVEEYLPNVCYIGALYTITEEYNNALEKLGKLENIGKEKKSLIVAQLDKKFLEYKELKNIPNILQKYLFKEALHLHNMKFIVFCNKVNEIDETKKMVKEWFEDCYKDTGISKEVRLYDVHYGKGRKKNQQITNQFENSKGDNVIDIMVSVNMFNEGLHIEGVTGVIMLRKTQSNIIFLQQIGRVINQNNPVPFVFDFVNNHKSVGEGYIKLFEEEDWEYDNNNFCIKQKETVSNAEYKNNNKQYYTKSGEVINIHDETKDIEEIVDTIFEKYDYNTVLENNKQWLIENSRFYTKKEMADKFNVLEWHIHYFCKKYNLSWIKSCYSAYAEEDRKFSKDIYKLAVQGKSLPEIKEDKRFSSIDINGIVYRGDIPIRRNITEKDIKILVKNVIKLNNAQRKNPSSGIYMSRLADSINYYFDKPIEDFMFEEFYIKRVDKIPYIICYTADHFRQKIYKYLLDKIIKENKNWYSIKQEINKAVKSINQMGDQELFDFLEKEYSLNFHWNKECTKKAFYARKYLKKKEWEMYIDRPIYLIELALEDETKKYIFENRSKTLNEVSDELGLTVPKLANIIRNTQTYFDIEAIKDMTIEKFKNLKENEIKELQLNIKETLKITKKPSKKYTRDSLVTKLKEYNGKKTIKEMSKDLSISESYIRNLCTSYKITYKKINNQKNYNSQISDIIQIINKIDNVQNLTIFEISKIVDEKLQCNIAKCFLTNILDENNIKYKTQLPPLTKEEKDVILQIQNGKLKLDSKILTVISSEIYKPVEQIKEFITTERIKSLKEMYLKPISEVAKKWGVAEVTVSKFYHENVNEFSEYIPIWAKKSVDNINPKLSDENKKYILTHKHLPARVINNNISGTTIQNIQYFCRKEGINLPRYKELDFKDFKYLKKNMENSESIKGYIEKNGLKKSEVNEYLKEISNNKKGGKINRKNKMKEVVNFIKNNYEDYSIQELATKTKVSNTTVRRKLKELELYGYQKRGNKNVNKR